MATKFSRPLVSNIIKAYRFSFIKATLSRERAVDMIALHCDEVIAARTPAIPQEEAARIIAWSQKQDEDRAKLRLDLKNMKDMVSAHYDVGSDDDTMLIENLEVEIDRALAKLNSQEDP